MAHLTTQLVCIYIGVQFEHNIVKRPFAEDSCLGPCPVVAHLKGLFLQLMLFFGATVATVSLLHPKGEVIGQAPKHNSCSAHKTSTLTRSTITVMLLRLILFWFMHSYYALPRTITRSSALLSCSPAQHVLQHKQALSLWIIPLV